MEWKDINDDYEVSIAGEVRNKRTKRVLKNHNVNGYRYCRIGGAKAKKMGVHHLIALYFLDNPNNYTIVDHIDRNKANNHISNLRWVSKEENAANRTLETKPRITNETGEHHIKIVFGKSQLNPSYVVLINTKLWGKHYKCCKSMEEAIEYRDNIINAL